MIMLSHLAHLLMNYGLNSLMAQAIVGLWYTIFLVGAQYVGVGVVGQYAQKLLPYLFADSHKKWATHDLTKKTLRWVSIGISGLIYVKGATYLEELKGFVEIGATIHFIGLGMFMYGLVMALSFGLGLAMDFYDTFAISKRVPIRSYVQILTFFLWTLTTIIFVCVLLGESPSAVFAGLGALTAVILLIFKDTILGFVASIQVTLYDIVRIGDWVTIPEYGVDGDVMEISVSTVKVRNFDKTISSIPTASLINKGVKNWRGMKESGGRRIKRSLLIDVQSIRFCEAADLQKLAQLDLLTKTLATNDSTLKNHTPGEVGAINEQRYTNAALFRMYVKAYLQQNQDIHQDGFTFLVRQLDPSEHGLPLEIYIFVNNTNWPYYEDVQAAIFDHLLASMPTFGLRHYQNIIVEHQGDIRARETPNLRAIS